MEDNIIHYPTTFTILLVLFCTQGDLTRKPVLAQDDSPGEDEFPGEDESDSDIDSSMGGSVLTTPPGGREKVNDNVRRSWWCGSGSSSMHAVAQGILANQILRVFRLSNRGTESYFALPSVP